MRIAKPVRIEVVGGNGYRMNEAHVQRHGTPHERHLTYQAEGLAEVGAGGKYAQNRYDILQRLQDFETCFEFTAGPCLFVKKSGNEGEWMFD